MKNRKVLALMMAGFVFSASFSPAVLAEDEYFDLSSEVLLLDEAEDYSFEDGAAFQEPVQPEDTQEIIPVEQDPVTDESGATYEEVSFDETGWDTAPVTQYTDESVWEETQDIFIQDDMDEPIAEGELTPEPSVSPVPSPTPGEELTPTPIVPSNLDTTKPVYVYSDGEDDEPMLTYTVDTIEQGIALAQAAGLDMVDMSISRNLVLEKTIEVPENFSLFISTEGDFSLLRGAAFTGSFFVVKDGAFLTLSGNSVDLPQEDGTVKTDSYTLTVDGTNISTIAPLVYIDEGGSLSVENGVIMTRSYSSHQGSAIFVSKDAASLSIMGSSINTNMSLAEDGAAVYVEEGFTGNFNIGDGNPVTIDGNSRIVGNETIPSNIYLAKAGEEGAQIMLTGDLEESSKLSIHVGNPVNGLPVVVDSDDGFVEDFASSMENVIYERSGFTLTTEGTLSDGSTVTPTITVTGTPSPEETVTVTPTPDPYLTITDTPTPTPYYYVTITPTPTSVPYLTPTSAARSPYRPDVASAADGFRVTGLESPLEFPAGSSHTFTVWGATAETRYSSSLVVGDGKWSPFYWTTGTGGAANQKPTDENSVFDKRDFTIAHKDGLYNQSSTVTITIYFKLFTWGGTGWIPQATVQSTQTRFTVAQITPTSAATPTSRVTPTSAGSSTYAYYTATPTPYSNSNGTVSTNTTDYLALTRAAQTPGAAVVTTTAGTVNTADNSPLGAYVLLAVLSFLAGSFAIIRRRKNS